MRKVQIGQPLRLPASTFNTMLDAAQDYRNRSMTTRGHGLPVGSQSGIVTVRNESGADQDQFAVMGISGLVVNPADNAREFFYRYALTVVTPTADHDGKFVVLQEPIRNGGLGRAMIAGVTPVNILGDSAANSTTAGISDGQTYLEADGDGAQILWEEATSGEQEHLAFIRFPFGGSSGPAWHDGDGEPDADLGSDEDYYLDDQSGAVYLKSDGAWDVIYSPSGGGDAVTAKMATTGPVTLSGLQTIDGLGGMAGDKVLVKDQAPCGVYLMQTGAWTQNVPFTPGQVAIQGGTANQRLVFVRAWGGGVYVPAFGVYG